MSAAIVPTLDPATGWPVWGQARAVLSLQQAVVRGPGHAWVFAGPGGTGKYLAAMTFAKVLCCPHRREGDTAACDACSVCRRIDRGVFPDVVEFSLIRQAERDGNKSRNLTLNVATVREVAATVSFRPSEAAWKVVIVRDAETMQETAQEAFLKTLEEPPAYAVIMLLAEDLEPILPTIQSRCTVVRFDPVPEHQIEASLTAGGIDRHEASTIAAVAEGSIGWSFRAANEQAMLDERLREVNEAKILVAGSTYDRLVACVRLADEFPRDRDAALRRLALTQQVWRDYLDTALGLADQQPDPVMARQIVTAIRSIDRCMANLEANVRPRLAMEAMVAAWPPMPT